MNNMYDVKWKEFKRHCFRFVLFFTLLFILTCPFGFTLLPDAGKWINPLFEFLSKYSGDHFFDINRNYEYRIMSDSTGFYLHAFNLVFVSLLCTLFCFRWDRAGKYDVRLRYCFQVLVRVYLALILLIYGFNKVFKYQFYAPEPNTLFTPLGDLYKDILFWSTIGSSYSYSVFAGIIEVIPAVMLLFRRTYLAGAIIAFAVLLNVVMINFSFDVSVKLFSLFLLFLSAVLIIPESKRLFGFFFGEKNEIISEEFQTQYQPKGKVYMISKIVLIALLFAESTNIYFRMGYFNGDETKKHALYGAYQVQGRVKSDSVNQGSVQWKRVFFHSGQYFIVQNSDDGFEDFKYTANKAMNQLLIDGQTLDVEKKGDNELMLKGDFQSEKIEVLLKRINTDSLPLLEKGFHWTIDE